MYVKNASELISGAESSKERRARKLCIAAFEAALAAADPRLLVRGAVSLSGESLRIGRSKFDLAEFERIVVIGGGKASAAMASELESILGDKISSGTINVPLQASKLHRTRIVSLHPATHPFPSDAGAAGVRRMLELVGRPSTDTFVIALISGGGSALMPLPLQGVTIRDKAKTTRLLLNAGATIQELNIVRKHLSAIKGGRLARRLYPSFTVSLVISDVVGDQLDSIASGPLCPDTSTFHDAQAVLGKYRLEMDVSARVLGLLRSGTDGRIPETPKPGAVWFGRVRHFILGNNTTACMGAYKRLRQEGTNPVFLTSRLEGEARDVGTLFGKIASDETPDGPHRSLVAGGESTVTVKGTGKGGRNQEAALAALKEAGSKPGLAMAFAGSDGTDGSTGAAGAIVDRWTLERAESSGLDLNRYLVRNDSHSFFKKTGDLILTGPTGTNVNDIWLSVRC